MTSVSDFPKGGEPSSTKKTMGKRDDARKLKHTEEYNFSNANLPREKNTGTDSVHKVTILNLPQEVVDTENHACNRKEGCMQDQVVLSTADHEREIHQFSSSESCMPILPWINGDGTINSVVFKGLRRRVLGIVMQSPGIIEVITMYIAVSGLLKLCHRIGCEQNCIIIFKSDFHTGKRKKD